jgi:hypothetical protein
MNAAVVGFSMKRIKSSNQAVVHMACARTADALGNSCQHSILQPMGERMVGREEQRPVYQYPHLLLRQGIPGNTIQHLALQCVINNMVGVILRNTGCQKGELPLPGVGFTKFITTMALRA